MEYLHASACATWGEVGVLILNLMLVRQMRTGRAAVQNKRCKASTAAQVMAVGFWWELEFVSGLR